MWNELIEEFLADQPDWDIKTERWYGRRLKDFREFLAREKVLRTGELEARHVKRYLGWLRREGLSWSTRNGAFTILSRFCGWLYSRGLNANPFDAPDLRRPRRPRRVVRYVPLDTIERMIAAAEGEIGPPDPPGGGSSPGPPSPPRGGSSPGPPGPPRGGRAALVACRDAAIMRLLATTGMRRIEIVRLDVSDLDLAAGLIPVIRGKADHERAGYLTAETAAGLRRWLAWRPWTKSQALFVSLQANKKGLYQRLQPDAINDICLRWRDAAGLPKTSVSPHKWRHTFGTVMARAGNPFALKELMGHADLKTTEIYVHTDSEVLRQLVADFAPVVGNGRELTEHSF